MSGIEWKVLGLQNLEEVLEWERENLKSSPLEESEKFMAEWTAKWRRESLEHYLPLGWSMAAWKAAAEEKEFAGYFLAQPFLFFQGHTQVLWVEQLSAANAQIREELIDIAYRMAREKHLQTILFGGVRDTEQFTRYKGMVIKDEWVEIPTTKRG